MTTTHDTASTAVEQDEPAPSWVGQRLAKLREIATWQRLGHKLIRRGLVPIIVIGFGVAGVLNPPGLLSAAKTYPGLFLLLLFPIVLWPIWARQSVNRRTVARVGHGKNVSARKKARPDRPPMAPFWRTWATWVDIVFFHDIRNWRITYALLFLSALIAILLTPLDLNQPVPNSAIQAAAPLIFYSIVSYRCHQIGIQRSDIVKIIYNVAAAVFRYPAPGTTIKRAGDDAHLLTTDCIQVFEWESLSQPHQFFVPTSKSTSSTDGKVWAELGANLNERVDCSVEDGWHLDRDSKGRGATVVPADYPRGVLWDGEQAEDPMTFLVGRNLDVPDKWLKVAFSVTSPHFIVTGGTGTGKSSFAEALLVQATTKQMPWDPSLSWDCHIIDPKDAFHSRWQGRANITSTSGVEDTVNADGDTISGIEAMADHMRLLEADLKRRQFWLKDHGRGNAANWKDIDDTTKARTGFRPCLIVTDEYLDHTRPSSGGTEQTDRDNAARVEITRITDDIARKGRSLGMHQVVVLQRANMKNIGSDVVSNAQGRIVMGNIDRFQYDSMFGTTDVPVLPASTFDPEKEEQVPIPGRGRLMSTSGGTITRMQVLYFGEGNIETIDKWLPRLGLDEPNNTEQESISHATTRPDDTPVALSKEQSDDSTSAPKEWISAVPESETAQSSAPSPAAAQPATPPKPPAPVPEPATTTPRPRTTATTSDSRLAQVQADIQRLAAISPHTITAAETAQLNKLFTELRKLRANRKASGPPPGIENRSGQDLFG